MDIPTSDVLETAIGPYPGRSGVDKPAIFAVFAKQPVSIRCPRYSWLDDAHPRARSWEHGITQPFPFLFRVCPGSRPGRVSSCSNRPAGYPHHYRGLSHSRSELRFPAVILGSYST